jgi:hypothetical protein
MKIEEVRALYNRVSIDYACQYPDNLEEMELAVKLLQKEIAADNTITEEFLLAKVEELKQAQPNPQYRSKFATQIAGQFWKKSFVQPIERTVYDSQLDDQIENDDENNEWLRTISR